MKMHELHVLLLWIYFHGPFRASQSIAHFLVNSTNLYCSYILSIYSGGTPLDYLCNRMTKAFSHLRGVVIGQRYDTNTNPTYNRGIQDHVTGSGSAIVITQPSSTISHLYGQSQSFINIHTVQIWLQCLSILRHCDFDVTKIPKAAEDLGVRSSSTCDISNASFCGHFAQHAQCL